MTVRISVFGALVLAAVVLISPHAWTVAHKTTGDSVDALGLTMKAQNLPVQEYPAH